MNEVIRLVRIDFDGLENTPTTTETEIGIFGPSGTLSAYGVASRFLAGMQPPALYAGYDLCVYPQWRMYVRKLITEAP